MDSTTPQPRLGDRSLFPDLVADVYLGHAAISPPSRPVQDAIARATAAFAAEGAAVFGRMMAQREALRARIGRLVGANAEDVALTASTTAGLITVALGLDWKPGDRAIVFKGEFPTNITPWQQATARFGASVTMLDATLHGRDPAAFLQTLEDALKPGDVRAVAVSAVQFSTGLQMPVKAMADLCHAHGAVLVADIIQAAGAVPMDLRAWGVDFAAGGAHKWLMGVEGVGFLIARPEAAALLTPMTAGWLSHEEPLSFLLEGEGHLRYNRPIRKDIRFVEGSSASTVGIAALDASTALIEAVGVAEISAHIAAYLDPLEAGLITRGFQSLRAPDAARRSGTLSVRPPKGHDPIRFAHALAHQGVSVSTPDGLIRMAPHWPNALSEVGRVLEAVDACLAVA